MLLFLTDNTQEWTTMTVDNFTLLSAVSLQKIFCTQRNDLTDTDQLTLNSKYVSRCVRSGLLFRYPQFTLNPKNESTMLFGTRRCCPLLDTGHIISSFFGVGALHAARTHETHGWWMLMIDKTECSNDWRPTDQIRIRQCSRSERKSRW